MQKPDPVDLSCLRLLGISLLGVDFNNPQIDTYSLGFGGLGCGV